MPTKKGAGGFQQSYSHQDGKYDGETVKKPLSKAERERMLDLQHRKNFGGKPLTEAEESERKGLLERAKASPKEEKPKKESFAKRLKEKAKSKDSDFFGGEVTDNGHIAEWRHFVSEDEVVIATRNVEYSEKYDSLIMKVGPSRFVFVKPFNARAIKRDNARSDGEYAIRLSRKYWKAYDMRSPFADGAPDRNEDFDDYVSLAKEQDKAFEPHEWRLDSLSKRYNPYR